jgi:FkbH-like protein
MSLDLYSGLTWLPEAPADFDVRCRCLLAQANENPDDNIHDSNLGTAIRALATHALNEHQLARLGRIIDAARTDNRSLTPLTSFRLGLLGNGTLDLIVPVLIATAARHGIALECITGDYNQFLQEALLETSAVNRARPDAVLLALDYRGLPLQATPGDHDAQAQTIDGAIGLLNTIRGAIRQHGGAPCILQTVAPPPEGLFGSFDFALPGTMRSLVHDLNRRIAQATLASEDVLLDVAGLAETIGLAEWHSPALWNMAKLPFADAYVPLYADHIARVVGAIRGKSRRCLVLDLDNTVWGGVIGDDGVEGIKIAQGDPTGEAHLDVQKLALALRARGVVLAVSSKNTDSVARQPFRQHPEMLLKEEHIAVFQANWDDKATNIRAIAKELALGLESFVFLDDNPVERGLIRRELPEVAVPEVDSDPATYARTLAAAGYFEAVHFSDEDRSRAEMYQGNARRASLQKQASDLGAYLRSLNMHIVFGAFDRTSRARVAQLINKSNQFNLTTRRYTEAELAGAEADPGVFAFHARLIDQFGDNGIICVIICRSTTDGETDAAWMIDTWLMSCRVLGRCVEQMVLREIVLRARARGIRTLLGTYKPTTRNAMVREHYGKLGFTCVREEANGNTVWELPTDTDIEAAPMTVERDIVLPGPA